VCPSRRKLIGNDNSDLISISVTANRRYYETYGYLDVFEVSSIIATYDSHAPKLTDLHGKVFVRTADEHGIDRHLQGLA
jgi:hypothetical protein